MKQTHLVGLDWVVKELEGLHSTYEKQISQYEGEVNNHKREIDSKMKELTVVQSQLAQLDKDKKKAVEDVSVNISLLVKLITAGNQ
jgi:predicted  nucleic acid-binding Zn-ribbon protein